MWQHGAMNHDMTPDYLAEFTWSQRLKAFVWSCGSYCTVTTIITRVAWFSGTVTTTVWLTIALSSYFDIFTKSKGGGGLENAVAPTKVVWTC